MNIEKLKKKKDECRTWKNVAPWHKELQNAQKIEKNNLKIQFTLNTHLKFRSEVCAPT